MALIFSLLLVACRHPAIPMAEPPSAPVVVDQQPEEATGCRTDVTPVTSTGGIAVSAHPEASAIGAQVLRDGGTAADAAIAMAVALTLVEPQSSGLGGGAFVLHYDAATASLSAWDGREIAPAGTTLSLYQNESGPRTWPELVPGGLSVGVPGLVRLLEGLHQAHGVLSWQKLWEPTALLADKGFVVTPRMARSIAQMGASPLDVLARDADAAAYFLPNGEPLREGTRLVNPALAATARVIGEGGAGAFYEGPLAEALVQKVHAASVNPGVLSTADLASYRAQQREPVCVPFRGQQVCGHPPPTSGGITTLQIVGMLDGVEPSGLGPHAFVEAARLAWADREAYVADPDVVGVPTQAMLAPGYLAGRASGITGVRASAVLPGDFPLPAVHGNTCPPGKDTTHLVVADAAGNVVSMTSSIENAFGSGLFVNGFLLNNQLTDFSFVGTGANGGAVANVIAPCKRPRSSMSPVIVLDADGVSLAVGSPGGSRIIQYVARVVVDVINDGSTVQQAISGANVVARADDVEVEQGCGELAPGVIEALEAAGHTVRRTELNSGLHGIQRTPGGWVSGVDPRREGSAIAVP